MIANALAQLLVARIASQLLDPGMLIGEHGLGGQLTTDPDGRFGQDDSRVVFQRGQGCRAVAQPTPDDDQVGRDLAGRMEDPTRAACSSDEAAKSAVSPDVHPSRNRRRFMEQSNLLA